MTSWHEFDDLWNSDRDEDRQKLRARAQQDTGWAKKLRWEEHLKTTAQSLRPSLPESLQQMPRLQPVARSRPRTLSWRAAISAVAAALVLSTAWWIQHGLQVAPPAQSAELLSEIDLRSVMQTQDRFARERESLEGLIPAADGHTSPAREHVSRLDAAIAECKAVLATNPKHRHLREHLLSLSEQRNQLLRGLASEARG